MTDRQKSRNTSTNTRSAHGRAKHGKLALVAEAQKDKVSFKAHLLKRRGK